MNALYTPVEPHGQARGTTWFRRIAPQSAGLSGTTSRLNRIHPRLKPWLSAGGVN